MSVIGQFRREGDGFVGRVSTLAFDASLRLVPTDRGAPKGPQFLVLKGDVQVGAAWRAGETSGAVLNLKLDDPTWAAPLKARLMAAEDGVLPLTWIRPDPAERPPPSPDG